MNCALSVSQTFAPVPFHRMMRLLNKGKSTSGKQGIESVFRLRQDGWTMDHGRRRRRFHKKQARQGRKRRATGDKKRRGAYAYPWRGGDHHHVLPE